MGRATEIDNRVRSRKSNAKAIQNNFSLGTVTLENKSRFRETFIDVAVIYRKMKDSSDENVKCYVVNFMRKIWLEHFIGHERTNITYFLKRNPLRVQETDCKLKTN